VLRRWWDANVAERRRACQSASDAARFVSRQPAVYEKLKFRLDTAPTEPSNVPTMYVA